MTRRRPHDVPAGKVRCSPARRPAKPERPPRVVRLVAGSDDDRAGESGAVRALRRRLADLGAAPGGLLIARRVEEGR